MLTLRESEKRPALRYYGGKWNLGPWIISHFPKHTNYVEPCGGAASVLLQKPRSSLETYNDLEGTIVNFFRVLRDSPDELIRRVRLTMWARDEYLLSMEQDADPIESARRFFVGSWMSISGMGDTGWRCVTNNEKRNSPSFDLKVIEQSWLVERLRGVQIENKDCFECIETYDAPNTLIYFDPPYMAETRTHGQRYKIDADNAFHVRAAAALHEVEGMVIVSGYDCDLYGDLYEAHGWQRHDREAQTNGAPRIESVWLSPNTIKALDRPKQFTLEMA
jgi:DNA adenine methylase